MKKTIRKVKCNYFALIFKNKVIYLSIKHDLFLYLFPMWSLFEIYFYGVNYEISDIGR